MLFKYYWRSHYRMPEEYTVSDMLQEGIITVYEMKPCYRNYRIPEGSKFWNIWKKSKDKLKEIGVKVQSDPNTHRWSARIPNGECPINGKNAHEIKESECVFISDQTGRYNMKASSWGWVEKVNDDGTLKIGYKVLWRGSDYDTRSEKNAIVFPIYEEGDYKKPVKQRQRIAGTITMDEMCWDVAKVNKNKNWLDDYKFTSL